MQNCIKAAKTMLQRGIGKDLIMSGLQKNTQ